jgi:hypothetical protein
VPMLLHSCPNSKKLSKPKNGPESWEKRHEI